MVLRARPRTNFTADEIATLLVVKAEARATGLSVSGGDSVFTL